MTNIRRKITEEGLNDLLCCAMEGGSNYWVDHIELVWPEGETEESMKAKYPDAVWHNDLPFKGGAVIVYAPDRIESGKVVGADESTAYRLDLKAMNKGLRLMRKPKYRRHYEDFITDNFDAITGDVFLQLSLFGEVIYG